VSSPLLLELQRFLAERCFGDIEHRVVGAPSGELGITLTQEYFSRVDGSPGFLEEFRCLGLHAALAS
jgi:hypothetical protein